MCLLCWALDAEHAKARQVADRFAACLQNFREKRRKQLSAASLQRSLLMRQSSTHHSRPRSVSSPAINSRTGGRRSQCMNISSSTASIGARQAKFERVKALVSAEGARVRSRRRPISTGGPSPNGRNRTAPPTQPDGRSRDCLGPGKRDCHGSGPQGAPNGRALLEIQRTAIRVAVRHLERLLARWGAATRAAGAIEGHA